MRCDTPGYCPWAASTGPHNQADGRGHRHRRVARLRHGLPLLRRGEPDRRRQGRTRCRNRFPGEVFGWSSTVGARSGQKAGVGCRPRGGSQASIMCPMCAPGCNQGAPAVPTCMSITRCSRLISWTRCLRNEKVRGSSALSSTVHDRALTRCDTTTTRESATCHSDSTTSRAPCVAPAVQAVQTGPIGRGSWMVKIEVGGGNRCVPPSMPVRLPDQLRGLARGRPPCETS
jgi:hypothetical protein